MSTLAYRAIAQSSGDAGLMTATKIGSTASSSVPTG
jgi:hypothetical protein